MSRRAKSATTHCEYLYPARIIASPFNYWLVTQVFPGRDPRNSLWTTCVLLCPQNLNNLRRTCNSLLTPDPEWSPFVRIRVICSHWIWVSHQLKVCNDRWKNIRTSLEIHDFIYMCLLCCQITFINLFVKDPAVEWIRVTDWFHKLKVTDLNISERVNNSPFFIDNKIIEKYHI